MWYNFDGEEKVQPLVHLYHPQATAIYKFPDKFPGINDDPDIGRELKSGA